MAFANVLMLAGIAAIAVPVVIHLLTRRNVRTTPWGAMMFLAAAFRRRRRKLLLEDALLLVCRCMIPALLAIAFARPFAAPSSSIPWIIVIPAILLAAGLAGAAMALWRHRKARRYATAAAAALLVAAALSAALGRRFDLARLGGSGAQDVAVVIDGSASMSLVGDDGKSNFKKAVEEAGKYLDETSRSTSFAFLIGGPVPEILNPVPISDRRVLRDTLRSAKPSSGTMQAAPSLAAAAMVLAGGTHGVKRIVVIGDGQAEGWNAAGGGTWTTTGALLDRLRKPLVAWRTLPLPASLRNVAITGVSLDRPIVGTDRPASVSVTVENTGTETVTPRGVVVKAGSAEFSAELSKALEPGASQSFSIPVKFHQPGACIVSATVDAGDDMPADDSHETVVPVVGTLGVLIVDGDGPGPALSRSADCISTALRPAPRGKSGSGRFLFDPVTESFAKFSARTDFSDFAFVVLAGTPPLSPSSASLLADFVRKGGGLLVVPGRKTDVQSLNSWKNSGKPVLPAFFGEAELYTRQNESNCPSLQPNSFSLAQMQALRSGTDLGRVRFLSRQPLIPTGERGSDAVAAFDDGKIALSGASFGRGYVAVSAFAFDGLSSNLATSRSFVPFVHALASRLSLGTVPTLAVPPSDGIVLALSPPSALPAVARSDDRRVFAAEAKDARGDGFIAEIAISPSGIELGVKRPLVPGVYEVEVPPEVPTKLLRNAIGPDGKIRFAVVSNSRESNIAAISREDVEKLRRFISISTATSIDDVFALLRGAAFGREFWRIFAFAALALLIAETGLERWISTVRREAE